MPHFILEYSSNLDDELNVSALFEKLHETAIATGVFPIGGIRSRAIRCDQYRIAEGDPANAFIHLTAKIGAGRDLEIRKATAEKVFKTLTNFLGPIFNHRYLSIGFELTELEPVLSFKKNNIHQKFKPTDKS